MNLKKKINKKDLWT